MKKTFNRKSEERRFEFAFMTIMQEYYKDNEIKDYDIFDIDWDDLNILSDIIKNRNAAIDYSINRLSEEMDDEEEKKYTIDSLKEWIEEGLIPHCKYYSLDDLKKSRREMLKDYIDASWKSKDRGDVFRIKNLEKKLKTY